MRMVPKEQTFGLLRAYGVDPKPSVENCEYFELRGVGESRFWLTPRETRGMPYFFGQLLASMDAWREVVLWPRHLRWTFASPPANANDLMASATMKSAGIPEHAAGAAIFSRDELEKILVVLTIHASFGINTHDDLFLVPDHAQQLLQVDHHDVVHVVCRTNGRMEAFVQSMAEKEFHLPAECPDGTFKRPGWMRSVK